MWNFPLSVWPSSSLIKKIFLFVFRTPKKYFSLFSTLEPFLYLVNTSPAQIFAAVCQWLVWMYENDIMVQLEGGNDLILKESTRLFTSGGQHEKLMVSNFDSKIFLSKMFILFRYSLNLPTKKLYVTFFPNPWELRTYPC